MEQLQYDKLKSMTLGEKLRLLRKDRKFTQVFVAQELGMTKSLISMYEADKRAPGREALVKLAELYDVSIDFIIGRNEDTIKSGSYNAGTSYKFNDKSAENFTYMPSIPMYNTLADYKNLNLSTYATQDNLLVDYSNDDLFFMKINGGKITNWALCESVKGEIDVDKNYLVDLSGALVIVRGKDIPQSDRKNIVGKLKFIINLY